MSKFGMFNFKMRPVVGINSNPEKPNLINEVSPKRQVCWSKGQAKTR